jgi:adhesin transport system outer membrane protein
MTYSTYAGALRSPLSAGLLSLLISSAAFAQTSTADAPLTLDGLLSIIEASHPAVQAARGRKQAAGSDLDSAQYERFPRLEVDTGKVSGSSTNQSTIRLTQPLYTWGRIDSTISASEKRLDGAAKGIQEVARQVQEDGLTAFFDVLRNRERAATARANTEAHVRFEEMTERRFKSGVGSENDYELAKVRTQQARNDETATLAQVRRAEAALRTILGTDVRDISAPPQLTVSYGQEFQLVDATLINAPQLSRVRREADAVQFDAQVAAAQTKPQFVVRAERLESPSPSNFKDSRLVAAIQYSPGAGLSAFSNAEARAQRAMAALQDVSNTERDLIQKARTLFNDYRQTQEQLPTLDNLKKSNAALVESFVRQFQAGKRSWVDVLNSQREATQAALSYVDVYFNAQSLASRIDLLAKPGDAK